MLRIKPYVVLPLIVATLLAFVPSLSANTEQDAVKKRFDQAVDRLACLVAIESLNDKTINDAKDKKVEQSSLKTVNDCGAIAGLIEGKVDTENLRKTVLKLKEVGEGVPETRADAIGFFIQSLFKDVNPESKGPQIEDAAKALREFAAKPTRNDKNLTKLLGDFEDYLKNIYLEDRVAVQRLGAEGKPIVSREGDPEGSWLDSVDFVDLSPIVDEFVVISIVVAIGLFVYVVWHMKTLSDEVRGIHQRIDRVKETLKESASRSNPPRRAPGAGGPMIKPSEDVVGGRSYEETPSSPTADVGFSSAPQVASEPEYPKSIFLPSPTPDGFFNDGSRNGFFREGTSIYRFNLRSENDAEFQIHNHPEAIKSALLHPERNIDPVCTSADFRPSGTVEVVTEVPGRARREGDKWIVVQKAKVGYRT